MTLLRLLKCNSHQAVAKLGILPNRTKVCKNKCFLSFPSPGSSAGLSFRFFDADGPIETVA